MKIRIVVSPTGEIAIFADEGTFENGKQKIEAIMSALQAIGLPMDEIGAVEQHRHDTEHAHSHTHTNGHTHSH